MFNRRLAATRTSPSNFCGTGSPHLARSEVKTVATATKFHKREADPKCSITSSANPTRNLSPNSRKL